MGIMLMTLENVCNRYMTNYILVGECHRNCRMKV